MTTLRMILPLALAILANPVGADDATLVVEAKKCAALDGAGLRMTCYDAVFKGNGIALLPEATAAKPDAPGGEVVDLREEVPEGGKWQIKRSKSAMTDQETVFLSVMSNEMVQCQQFGSPSYVTLLARCMEDTTSVLIAGDCHLASGFQGYGEVTLRLDDGKPFSRNMDASTDSQALGLWDGGQAIPLLKQMLGKERMITRFTPFGANPVEPSFDIAGLDDMIQPLREACGW